MARGARPSQHLSCIRITSFPGSDAITGHPKRSISVRRGLLDRFGQIPFIGEPNAVENTVEFPEFPELLHAITIRVMDAAAARAIRADDNFRERGRDAGRAGPEMRSNRASNSNRSAIPSVRAIRNTCPAAVSTAMLLKRMPSVRMTVTSPRAGNAWLRPRAIAS